MTKGIVTCNLIKRLNNPSVNAERNGYFVSGEEVEIADVLLGETENDYYDGTPSWYRLTNGAFIWSGGVSINLDEAIFKRKLHLDDEVRRKTTTIPIVQTKFEYSKEIKLSGNFQLGDGKGISIAILDSGIDKRHFTKNSNISFSNDNRPDDSKHPHGTNVSGILISDNEELKGLCPDSNIMDFFVTDLDTNINSDKLLKALKAINRIPSSPPCDIINMSIDFSDSLLPAIQVEAKSLLDKGVIIVVASGNGDDSETVSSKTGGHAVTVGVFHEHNYLKHITSGFKKNHKIWYLNSTLTTPNEFTNTSINRHNFNQCSAFSAITSGLIAKFLSAHRDIDIKKRPALVDNFISKISFNIRNEDPSNPIPTPLKPFIQ